ncbi:MAG: hypothetical protein NVSMB23_05310 [Myxococcales bacterium]
MGPRWPALLVGLVLAGPLRADPPADPRARLIAARVPELGDLAILATAGRPFASLSLDYGLFSAVALGLGYDFAQAGFSRAGAHVRVRALRLDRLEVGVRLSLLAVLPRTDSGFGARAIARTGDGELGVLVSYAPLEAVAVFAEAYLLGETDFGRPRTAGFLGLDAGAEWTVLGPLALVGRLGLLRGARGSAATFSAGAGVHF